LPKCIKLIKSRTGWVRYATYSGLNKNARSVFVGKPERKRPLVSTKHRWENKTKMDLKEIGCM
jgi:hypothetical protein